jgi:hypothetical protein
LFRKNQKAFRRPPSAQLVRFTHALSSRGQQRAAAGVRGAPLAGSRLAASTNATQHMRSTMASVGAPLVYKPLMRRLRSASAAGVAPACSQRAASFAGRPLASPQHGSVTVHASAEQPRRQRWLRVAASTVNAAAAAPAPKVRTARRRRAVAAALRHHISPG